MTHCVPTSGVVFYLFLCDAGLFLSEGVFAGLVPRSSGCVRCLPSAFGVGGTVGAAGGTSPISAIQFVSVVFTLRACSS